MRWSQDANQSREACAVVAIALCFFACVPTKSTAPKPPAEPTVSGSALLVDVSPVGRPALVGAYDFELLGQSTGTACVDRADNSSYWLGMNELAKLAPDPTTRQAIAAATLDATAKLEADTLVLTNVTTKAKGTAVCASVFGRGRA